MNEDKLSPQSLPSPMQYYAIGADDEIIKRFKLQLRSGETFSIPYSLLPIYILTEGRELAIIAYELVIIITGRNLDPIEEYLSKETLLWIKESPSQKDDGQSPIYISDIAIKGKAIRK